MRKSRGLTQRELGCLVGLDQSNISRIEAGKKDISVRTLKRIASALGVRPDELLDEGECAPDDQR